MSTDETYNGWANRETWAFNLHWQNDESLYVTVRDCARELLDGPSGDVLSDSWLGESVVNHIRDTIKTWDAEYDWDLPEELVRMRDEVGSWWRIDYAEVGAAVREDLS